MVLATSASPLGSVLGGIAIEQTGSVEGVYAGVGALMVLIAFGFTFTVLGQAERYLPGGDLEATYASNGEARRRVAADTVR
jgi:hypothetical protein